MRANSQIRTRRVELDPDGEFDPPDGDLDDEPTAAHAVIDTEPLVLNRYRLGRRLGSGGFASVHAAHDERLDRQVAIKILPRERVIHSRFQREARAAARLHHPAIVTLFEAAVDDEGAYLVSELVKGSTLDQTLARGELSDRDILEVAISVADGLEHAHANDVIHRDVKPQNVLVPPRRASARNTGSHQAAAKLTDFGVAHVIGTDSLTRTGDVIGTLAYMSPEQAEGSHVGPASDLYSLALLAYESLTGVNPVADNIRRGANRRLGTYLPPLRRQRADLPRHLGSAIDRALRPRPSERGTVLELRIALVDSLALVDDVAGIVAPAKPISITRRSDPDRGPRPDRSRDPGPSRSTRRTLRRADPDQPGPEWDEEPRTRRAPATEPPAGSRTTSLQLAPRGLLLLAGGLIAVGLGFIGLAGAWPALVSQTVRGFWRRALLGAAGLTWLGVAAASTPRDFYFALGTLTATTVKPVAIGAVIWAIAAAIGPPLVRGRRPGLDLLVVSTIAAATALAIALSGLQRLDGLVLGALLGWLIVAHRPLLALIRASINERRLP